MDEVPWTAPVLVQLTEEVSEYVTGPKSALNLLVGEKWPEHRGRQHQQALRACYRALEYEPPLGDGRQAFLAAVEEANLAVGN
jgi:hypothetical protein